MRYLPLKFQDERYLKIREERFAQTHEELQKFLEGERHLHTKAFAKDVMFSHELKANNQIEGYNDDVKIVREIIESKYKNSEQAKRILNLYHGYNYILKEKDINPENLKKLYSILSKDLLDPKDKCRMGEYYRNDKVYILIGGNLSNEPDEGIESTYIEYFMTQYFEFLNNLEYNNNITDEFIKSQILHFYFVYIHPYFDVNGRTSRTMAMWYLLKKKAYPYIIFNRGITLKGNKYDKAIIDVKKYKDISYFIDFMLKTVQCELEKEYIMQHIQNRIPDKLSSQDWQTLLYLLSMNGIITVSDFVNTYNRFHDKKKAKVIYETMIDSLKQKEILNVSKTTSSFMFDKYSNEVLEFNPRVMDYDKDKIKRLVRYKD